MYCVCVKVEKYNPREKKNNRQHGRSQKEKFKKWVINIGEPGTGMIIFIT
jgi:hypothetical protein